MHTSWLQRVPFARSHHRHMLPLYPKATESLDLRSFDLVLSSDSGPIKGVLVDPGATHICYCHSPMRYLWDGYDAYRARMGPLTRAIFTATAGRVRAWDRRAAERVTYFIANSQYVADRIRRAYGRESIVIHPPIDLGRAMIDPTPDEHYLCAGRLVGYKRTELLIEACRRLGRTLRIAGAGPELARLQRLAGPDVTFLGELPTETLWKEYSRCRALLFAADEDFGMVPLEAQACGRPVIAFGKGGSLETVRGGGPQPTGIYFSEQTTESLAHAILRFEAADREGAFDPVATHRWTEQFAAPVFLQRMREFVLSVMPAAAEAMLADPSSPTEVGSF